MAVQTWSREKGSNTELMRASGPIPDLNFIVQAVTIVSKLEAAEGLGMTDDTIGMLYK